MLYENIPKSPPRGDKGLPGVRCSRVVPSVSAPLRMALSLRSRRQPLTLGELPVTLFQIFVLFIFYLFESDFGIFRSLKFLPITLYPLCLMPPSTFCIYLIFKFSVLRYVQFATRLLDLVGYFDTACSVVYLRVTQMIFGLTINFMICLSNFWDFRFYYRFNQLFPYLLFNSTPILPLF